MKTILVEGIRLESRSGTPDDFSILRGVVFDFNDADRAKVYSLYVDAAQFVIVLRAWDDDTAEYIAHVVQNSLWKHLGGAGGISVDGGPVCGQVRIGERRYRQFTIPGEWREDITPSRVYEVLFEIRKRWPVAFSNERSSPLKIKIFDDICAAFPKTNTREIKMSLGLHCRSDRYLRALIERLPRLDLDGHVTGEVTMDQVQIARRQLGTEILEEGV